MLSGSDFPQRVSQFQLQILAGCRKPEPAARFTAGPVVCCELECKNPAFAGLLATLLQGRLAIDVGTCLAR